MADEIRQFVLFRLGEEEYGLPIDDVSSIIRWEKATPVPHAPPEVEGVINLRGQVVPVVDLRRRFAGAEAELTEPDRIVVTESAAGKIGLAVDTASEVCSIPAEEIRPAPDSVLTAETAEAFEGVAHIGGRLVILLRLDSALPDTDLARAATEGGGGEDG